MGAKLLTAFGAAIIVAIVIAVVVSLIILFPIITIWSLNTLFGLTIPFTIKTWLAAIWLASVVGSSSAAARKYNS